MCFLVWHVAIDFSLLIHVQCMYMYIDIYINIYTNIYISVYIYLHVRTLHLYVFDMQYADGAEMLLDLGLPAALIGGIVLPLLGAVPDSAMIIASGVGGSKEDANKEIAVGMGCVSVRFSASVSCKYMNV